MAIVRGIKGGIVCATRGGESSRLVQMEGIRMAATLGKPLVFIYVVDTAVMAGIDEGLITAVHDELLWMGKTLLRIAQRRAGAADLDAQLVIREGNVREEISQFLRESEATVLLLGAPRGTTANIFGDDAIERFAASVQAESAVDVRIVYPETS